MASPTVRRARFQASANDEDGDRASDDVVDGVARVGIGAPIEDQSQPPSDFIPAPPFVAGGRGARPFATTRSRVVAPQSMNRAPRSGLE
jgi:hypothetical protein